MNTVALCREMNRLGHHSLVATTDLLTPAQAVEIQGGATVADFPPGSEDLELHVFPVRFPKRLAYAPELSSFLRQAVSTADVVHVHSVNLYAQYAAWRSSAVAKRPFVLSPRGALDPWIRGRRRYIKQANDFLWQRRMLDDAYAIHLTTEEERQLIAPMHIRAPQIVIPNGIEVDRFRRPGNDRRFREEWLGGYNGPLIMNHGRLSEKKGLDVLLRSLEIVRTKVDAHLVFVGADDEGVGNQLRRHAKATNLARHVTIVPPLSGSELVGAIHSADVWALPSYTENFGMAVVEAMAAGRAVVTSPHVNIAPEASVAGALLMVENSPEAVAIALCELLQNSELRDTMGADAAAYVQRFDWSVIARQFEALYQSASGGA